MTRKHSKSSSRTSRRGPLPLFTAATILFGVVASSSGQSLPAQAQTPIDLLRRADDLTDIRLPGSAPFHIKVTFHAFPGMDFAKPGKSDIVTGDGTYEEWWLAPHEWRREVTFGAYHAVEVENAAGRKFQTTSDYEPSRVLMLLTALYHPISRWVLEPELLKHPPKWDLRHLTLQDLSITEVSWRDPAVRYPDGYAYDLLPNGAPARMVDNGITAIWEKEAAFGGKIVPGHLELSAVGRTLLTADLTLAPDPESRGGDFDLPGNAALPGETLRPLDFQEVKVGRYIGDDPVTVSENWGPDLSGSGFHVRCVYDRAGTPREVEIIDTYPKVGPKGEAALPDSLIDEAKRMVQHVRQDVRVHVTIDGNPCEWAGGFVNGG